MSEQISGTHGHAEDDAIKSQDRGELRGTGEEELLEDEEELEEELGDESADDPQPSWAAEGRFAGTPGEDWDAIELRSDLARLLGRHAYPVTREHLIQTLSARSADRLADLVSSLPAGATFDSLSDLLQALGVPEEHRPG
jgi:hypothetical protein